MPSLQDFIELSTVRNAWVTYSGLKGLYVRKGRLVVHMPDGTIEDPKVLTIANIEAKKPGSGVFTRLIHWLVEIYPDCSIMIENVLDNKRFERKLLRMGFVQTADELPCFILGERYGTTLGE